MNIRVFWAIIFSVITNNAFAAQQNLPQATMGLSYDKWVQWNKEQRRYVQSPSAVPCLECYLKISTKEIEDVLKNGSKSKFLTKLLSVPSNDINATQVDGTGNTLFQEVACLGRVDLVQYLLANKAVVAQADIDKATAIRESLYHDIYWGDCNEIGKKKMRGLISVVNVLEKVMNDRTAKDEGKKE